MAIQALRRDAPGNPRTVEEARAFVKHVKSLFMPWNVDALVDGFTRRLRRALRHVAGVPRARRRCAPSSPGAAASRGITG